MERGLIKEKPIRYDAIKSVINLNGFLLITTQEDHAGISYVKKKKNKNKKRKTVTAMSIEFNLTEPYFYFFLLLLAFLIAHLSIFLALLVCVRLTIYLNNLYIIYLHI